MKLYAIAFLLAISATSTNAQISSPLDTAHGHVNNVAKELQDAHPQVVVPATTEQATHVPVAERNLLSGVEPQGAGAQKTAGGNAAVTASTTHQPTHEPNRDHLLSDMEDAIEQLQQHGVLDAHLNFNAAKANGFTLKLNTPSRRQQTESSPQQQHHHHHSLPEMEYALHQLQVAGALTVTQPPLSLSRRSLLQASNLFPEADASTKLNALAREIWTNIAPSSCANNGKLMAIARELFTLSFDLQNIAPSRRQTQTTPQTTPQTTTTTTTTKIALSGDFNSLQKLVNMLQDQNVLDRNLRFNN